MLVTMASNSGMKHSPSEDAGGWSGPEYGSGADYGDGSQIDSRNAQGMGLNFFKQFGGVQKKVTRDGQPAKRRGPKPDSKPAQTRRQELNRQAQRTHRERKEQYIKALEIELARLREAFAENTGMLQATLDQQKGMLRENQRENHILRDILTTHGIPFENEIENRKAQMSMQSHRAQSAHPRQSPIAARPNTYQSVISAPSSSTGYTPMPESVYGNGRTGSISGGSASGTTHHSHSPAGPDIMEQSIKQEGGDLHSIPGVFEMDPQLGIDFILALEATCRDHSEYLVRRSLDSPDDLEEAQFSGHALMASVPPPNHINSTPAQGGGLIPTYKHQVPDIPLQSLNTLLNLSKQLQLSGQVEGGQVTPIMALQSLRSHRSYTVLTRDDVVGMIESIRNKVRCYGFGAVMEDFELRDALSSIFATKQETYDMAFGNEGMEEVDDLYS